MESALRVVLRVGAFVLACAVVLAAVAPAAARLPMHLHGIATGAITALAAFLLTILFARWDRVDLGAVGVAPSATSAVRFALGLAVGLGLVAVWALLSIGAGHVRWVAGRGATVSEVALAVFTYVALAAREELAFRGYPLRRLEGRFGAAASQVTVAILFGLEHRLAGASWSDAMLGAASGSLLFGAAALASDGLALPIGIHAAWNLGRWSLGLTGDAGIWRVESNAAQVEAAYRIGLLLHCMVMLTAAAVFTWMRGKRQRNASSAR